MMSFRKYRHLVTCYAYPFTVAELDTAVIFLNAKACIIPADNVCVVCDTVSPTRIPVTVQSAETVIPLVGIAKSVELGVMSKPLLAGAMKENSEPLS